MGTYRVVTAAEHMHDGHEHLSPRERQVLTLIAEGNTLPAIATLLSISIHSVKAHARHAYTRLGARTSAHAVAIAIRRGEIVLPAARPDNAT